MISEGQLRAAFPGCREPARWAVALAPALQRYEIDTRARIAAFLAQTGYESQQFNRVVENLVYSTPSRLMKVWPKRFTSLDLAERYLRNPEKLGNY